MKIVNTKGNNSKSRKTRVTIHAFCMLSHGVFPSSNQRMELFATICSGCRISKQLQSKAR